MGEGGVVVEAVGVVACGDEKLAGDIGADAVEGDEVGGGLGDERGQDGVEVLELGGELLLAVSDGSQSWFGRLGRVGWVAGPESGGDCDEIGQGKCSELIPELVGCGGDEAVELEGGLGTGLDR